MIWGLGDTALLPSQLDGLDALVPDLTVVKVDAGHFVPWENAPAVVDGDAAIGGLSLTTIRECANVIRASGDR